MERADFDPIVANFLKVIQSLRNDQQLTYEQLADLAGVHRTTIGLLERHERSPTIQVAHHIAKALGYPLSDLIKEAEAMTKGTSESSQPTLRFRQVNKSNLRNEDKLYQNTGLDGNDLTKAIELCYRTLDIIDDQLLSMGSPPLAELVELANLSSMVGNLIGSGIAEASSGLYVRNKPHTYPDLLPQKPPAVDLELKVALETNKPKGHLPKSGMYITYRYVLGDKSGKYVKGKNNRGNTVWIWEVKVGKVNVDDFSISNTEGDSGKTAVILTDVFNKMPLIYYVPSLLPYRGKIDGSYPSFN